MRMEERPITTLFMLESLDGKISSGKGDALDVDRDWCRIAGVKEGLHQYYELEVQTDFYSLNTGRVMAKIGVNERKVYHDKIDCRFIIIDNKPHLTAKGIDYICHWVDRLILVTTNRDHVAWSLREQYENLDILFYEKLDLRRLLVDMKSGYHADRITIQSGGELNSLFLREDLIDYVNVVIAPLLVGGRDTPTLIDGQAISREEELERLRALKLIACNRLNDSYLQLIYQTVR